MGKPDGFLIGITTAYHTHTTLYQVFHVRKGLDPPASRKGHSHSDIVGAVIDRPL